MSREENNQEAMRIIDLMVECILGILSNMKLNTMSTEEKVEQGFKFVDLIKKEYLVLQQDKQKLQDMTPIFEQLNQAKKQRQDFQLYKVMEQLDLMHDQFGKIH